MADAGNKAYMDWRSQYNKDIQAKQQGQATYASLQSNLGQMESGVMTGRGMMLNADKSVFDANMGANLAKSTGIEGLASVQEARRAETLKLAQLSALPSPKGLGFRV